MSHPAVRTNNDLRKKVDQEEEYEGGENREIQLAMIAVKNIALNEWSELMRLIRFCLLAPNIS